MKRLLLASLFLLVPALVQAKGSSWTPLTKNDKMVKTMIAKELNARKLGVSGTAHYTMTSVKGEKKSLGGSIYGTTTSIKFQAQPSVKVSSNGKTSWMKIGGVRGECKYASIMCQPPAISGLKITALLR
jgi:hypothetical protein